MENKLCSILVGLINILRNSSRIRGFHHDAFSQPCYLAKSQNYLPQEIRKFRDKKLGIQWPSQHIIDLFPILEFQTTDRSKLLEGKAQKSLFI